MGQEKKLNPDVVWPLVSYLYSVQLLDQKEGKYVLSRKGERFLKYTKGLFIVYHDAYNPVFYKLVELMRGRVKYGNGVLRESSALARGSGEFSKVLIIPVVRDLIQKFDFRKVMDIGCGDCEFLITLAKEGVAGVGVDIAPGAVRVAKTRISKERIGSRVQVVCADGFHPEKIPARLVGGVDAITSFLTLHEFLLGGAAFVEGVFRRYKTLFPGRHFILVEVGKEDTHSLRRSKKLNLEYQLVHELTLQGLASKDEWLRLFNRVGVNVIQMVSIPVANLYVYVLKL